MQLDELDEETFEPSFITDLGVMELQGNLLFKIPKMVSTFHSLYSLNLSRNQFEEIPYAVLRIPNLETLNMTQNHVTHLPHAISQLANTLQSLYLDMNPIVKITEKLLSLRKLHDLSLNWFLFVTDGKQPCL